MIRAITPDDAESYLGLCHQLDSESTYMTLEKHERQISVSEQRDRIKRLLKRPNQTILVAEAGSLAGYAAAWGGNHRRNQHRAAITVAMLLEHQRQGTATALYQKLEQWAWEAGIRRLELTVMRANLPAVQFYLAQGFCIEGTRRGSIHAGELLDEFYMGRLLYECQHHTNYIPLVECSSPYSN